jgi:hypothetical protein
MNFAFGVGILPALIMGLFEFMGPRAHRDQQRQNQGRNQPIQQTTEDQLIRFVILLVMFFSFSYMGFGGGAFIML